MLMHESDNFLKVFWASAVLAEGAEGAEGALSGAVNSTSGLLNMNFVQPPSSLS